MELLPVFLPSSMSLASFTLAAMKELPPASGWLAIMMRRCASLTCTRVGNQRHSSTRLVQQTHSSHDAAVHLLALAAKRLVKDGQAQHCKQ